VTPVSRAFHFYVPVEVSVDSAFPFGPRDPFVIRVLPSEEAVVFTPPTCDVRQVDLPPIDPDVLDGITNP